MLKGIDVQYYGVTKVFVTCPHCMEQSEYEEGDDLDFLQEYKCEWVDCGKEFVIDWENDWEDFNRI